MNSAIEKIGYDSCTGCYGCYNKCIIKNAITMKLTDDGFYKPFITDSCIGCGECKKSCPVITKVNNNKKSEMKVYAAWSKDEEILMNSSSGGMFSEIAKYILKENGVVFGAKWHKGEVIHYGITNLKELNLLQKSKYLQSKVENSYNEVKRYLELDKKVLFVGTPCQIAALKTLVNHKNLYLIDFVCHGIPSYKAYKKYIREMFNSEISQVSVDFRNKEDKGWNKFYIYLKYSNLNKIIKEPNRINLFFRGFLKNVYLNKPCYNCSFRSNSRYGDITLADFWGISKEKENSKGTSAIISNNKKGIEIINNIKKNIVLHEMSYKILLNDNPCLGSYKMSENNRENFFREIDKLSFKKLSKKYFKTKKRYLFCVKKIINYFH